MKLDFKERAQAKVSSYDNIDYRPGGGDKVVKIIKYCYFVQFINFTIFCKLK